MLRPAPLTDGDVIQEDNVAQENNRVGEVEKEDGGIDVKHDGLSMEDIQ